jgi:hypothetical protein
MAVTGASSGNPCGDWFYKTATGTVTITFAAKDNVKTIVRRVSWSIGAAPSTGSLQISVDGTVVYYRDIIGTAAVDEEPVEYDIGGDFNEAVVVSLLSTGTTNRLNVQAVGGVLPT